MSSTLSTTSPTTMTSPAQSADPETKTLEITKDICLAKNGLFQKKRFREISVRAPLTQSQAAAISPFLRAIVRAKLPPETPTWAVEALADPKILGPIMSNAELSPAPTLNMGQHPKLPASVLHRIERLLMAWYTAGKGEGALILHVDEMNAVTSSPPSSEADPVRPLLRDDQCVLLIPQITSSSDSRVIFQMGDRFCRTCKTCFPTPREQEVCKCGTRLEPLNLMLTIHSHPTFDAFSSCTDTEFEVPHVAFHMTMGHVDKLLPFDRKCALSFCTGQERVPLALHQLFDIEEWNEPQIVKDWITDMTPPKVKSPQSAPNSLNRDDPPIQLVQPVQSASCRPDPQAGAHFLSTIINDPTCDIQPTGRLSVTIATNPDTVIQEILEATVSGELSLDTTFAIIKAVGDLSRWAWWIEVMADESNNATCQEGDELWSLATIYAEILMATIQKGGAASTPRSSAVAESPGS